MNIELGAGYGFVKLTPARDQPIMGLLPGRSRNLYLPPLGHPD